MGDIAKMAEEHMREFYRLQDENEQLKADLESALKERDFLVSEYERAVKCGPQGFAHAAAHIYNAIVNAKCDVNADRFIKLMDRNDKLLKAGNDLAKMFVLVLGGVEPHPSTANGHFLGAWREAKN